MIFYYPLYVFAEVILYYLVNDIDVISNYHKRQISKKWIFLKYVIVRLEPYGFCFNYNLVYPNPDNF